MLTNKHHFLSEYSALSNEVVLLSGQLPTARSHDWKFKGIFYERPSIAQYIAILRAITAYCAELSRSKLEFFVISVRLQAL